MHCARRETGPPARYERPGELTISMQICVWPGGRLIELQSIQAQGLAPAGAARQRGEGARPAPGRAALGCRRK